MKRSLTILFTLFALIFSALGITSPAAAAQKNADLPSAAEFLNADGTLNLSAGYSGNLDISDYSVTIDPKRGPLFSPAQTLTPNAWNALGITPLNDWVRVIAISGTDVYVGGQFTDAGGDLNADNIAKWNGSAWSALDTGLNNTVYAIAISGTDVYVGGGFNDAGGDANADKIAKWNGSIWSALDTGLNNLVFAIAISGTDVYAGGYFLNAGGDANADYIAKWNGSIWSALGTTPLNNQVFAIAISGTDVYVGGYFTGAGGDVNADYIAKWDGSAWSALGTYPLNSTVAAIVISGTDVYVGGAFNFAGGVANADYITKWNGSAWSALGTTALNDTVIAIGISGAGVYAGGNFLNAGGYGDADKIAVFAIPPSVLSINRVNASPTNFTSVDFTVTFSEDVTDVDIADFKLTNTLLTGASITGVSGTGAVRTVTVNTGTGNGTIRLDILGTATIYDSVSNAFAGPTYTGQTYTVNKGTAPTVPLLVTPLANALVTSTPTLNWGDSAQVMALALTGWHYEINVTALGGFNQNYSTVNNADPSIGLGASQYTFVTSLPANTTYTWKVRSCNDSNQCSAYSLARTFRTKLATPVLNLPADATTENNKRPTFEWDEVPGATGYTLQILKVGVVVNTGTILAPAYTYTPTDLLPGITYTWKVKANGLNMGDYSAPFTFTTSINPPLMPVLFAPANALLVDSAVAQTLDWNPVNAVVSPVSPAAVGFEVQYATNSAFTGATNVVVDDNTLPGTHTAPISLSPGRTYYWHVRSWSGAGATGNHSAWSLMRTLKVKFVAPTLTSPINGASGGFRPTFVWSSGLNGLWTNYTLQVANNNLFTMSLRTFTINAPLTTYTIPNSLPALTAGLKYWRVKINGLYFPIFSVEVSPVNTFTP